MILNKKCTTISAAAKYFDPSKNVHHPRIPLVLASILCLFKSNPQRNKLASKLPIQQHHQKILRERACHALRQAENNPKGVEILTFCPFFGIWFSEGFVGVNWNISHSLSIPPRGEKRKAAQRIIEK